MCWAESRWNSRASIVENIQLPPTLLSRFDLIYIILDTPDKEKVQQAPMCIHHHTSWQDRKLAKHLVSFYFENAQNVLAENVLVRHAHLTADHDCGSHVRCWRGTSHTGARSTPS